MKLKELFKYNRAAGIAVLIAAILLAVFADANFALLGDRRDVKRAFKKTEMAAALTKCADELTWLCDSAAQMGVDTASARNAAAALKDAAASGYKIRSAKKAEDLFSAAVSVKTQLDALSADSNQTAYRTAMSHYSEIGSQLRTLAGNETYNQAVATLREDNDRPLIRLLAPWFDDVADYEALEARFGSKFPAEQPTEPADPSHPVEQIINSFSSLVSVIFDKAATIVTGLLDWLTRHVWMAFVLILFVLLGLFNGAKNK